jgi:hypothetical protein
MRPHEQTPDDLSGLERIADWFSNNKEKLRGRLREYKTLMSNFYISCKDPKLEDYLNFQIDIRYYPPEHRRILQEGFFVMYDTTLKQLNARYFRENSSWAPWMN